MLKTRHRLRHKSDIDKVYRYGRRHKIDSLFLCVRANNVGYMRATVIVSKKFSLKAVVRNKQRRILMAILEEGAPREAPFDIVLSYTTKGKMLSYNSIRSRIIQELKVLCA